jgi:hypothetical protein
MNKLTPTKNKASAAAISAGQKCFRSFLFIHQLLMPPVRAAGPSQSFDAH